ncbi:MAG: hypoxanthine phosphoribosyltransferase [Oligoflexia bacterium]|nr:hypoxanthine phosphoribosyltransferase [Oligoflexia bacterium]
MSDKLRILKTETEIKQRISEMGTTLTKKFKGQEPLAICVLSSSFIFFSDLIRAIDVDLSCEFLGVSSYKDKKVSSGEVEITLDLSVPLEGRDVILIEDMVDTGLTMNFLIKTLKARRPKSITTVALLLKRDALKTECTIDHIGFEVPNEFIVGYGIDYAGQFRNLPYLAVHE